MLLKDLHDNLFYLDLKWEHDGFMSPHKAAAFYVPYILFTVSVS